MKTFKCTQCDKEKSGVIRKGVCNSCSVSNFRRRQKLRAIKYKGGQCQKCGYNKCPASLVFHHLDPSQKDFGLSHNGTTKSWGKIIVELDKCILLCHNCHNEIHYEQIHDF
jgi:hypothetical protein